MSSGVFVFDVVVTLAMSSWLLFRYGDWMRHRVAVTVAVLVAWYFSFLIIFVLPLDVSSTTYRQCNATAYAEYLAKWHPPSVNATTSAAGLSRRDVSEAKTPKPAMETSETATIKNQPTAPPFESPCDPPGSLMPEHVLLDLWKVVYWSSQLLTWLVLPLMQSYTTVRRIISLILNIISAILFLNFESS